MTAQIVDSSVWDKAHELLDSYHYKEAIPLFLQEAEAGNAAAWYYAGDCYDALYDEFAASPDADAARHALECYHRAADAGDVDALEELGWVYHDGKLGEPQDYAKAYAYFKQAMDAGSAGAMAMVGDCYRCGTGVEQDYSTMIRYYTQAAEIGSMYACFQLAKFYAEGWQVERDRAKVAYYYRKTAETGANDGRYWYGYCCLHGYGTERDLDEAFRLFHLVGEEPTDHDRAWGHPAWTALGRCYEYGWGTEKNIPLAVQWYERAHYIDQFEGSYELGRCYAHGIGVERDMEKALHLYRIAAHECVAAAWFALAAYYEGEGADPEKAVYYKENGEVYAMFEDIEFNEEEHPDPWGRSVPEDEVSEEEFAAKEPQDIAGTYKNLFVAAERGDAQAQLKLAESFDKGLFLPRDPVRARFWYRQAATHGIPAAERLRKVVSDAPPTPPVDWKARFRGLLVAAAHGDMAAAGQAGWCYLKGRGARESASKAVALFRKAAKADVAEACYGLGVCYRNGRGVGKDEKEAVLWFERAAKQGLAAAQVAYADHLLESECYEKVCEGKRWYGTAARAGDADAATKLARLYGSGTSTYRDRQTFRDEVEWYRWTRYAANLGSATAVWRLGTIYRYNIGCTVRRSTRESLRWFRLAAEMNQPDAMAELAKYYEGRDARLHRKWTDAEKRQSKKTPRLYY